MARRLPLVAIAFFSLYACALFHQPLLGRKALFWHDVSIAYLPLRTAAAEAIREGRLPLWEPRMGNGFPVLAEGQAGVFYPLHALGYTGLPQHHVYALLVALHCALAGLFMALLCRAWDMRPAACLTAGLIYGCSGFFITHVLHITMLEAAAWLPLALLCVEMWLRRPDDFRWLAGAALSLGVQQLVAMPQIFFYSLLAVMLYLLVGALGRPATPGRGRWTARVALAAIAVVAGAVLVAAVQIIPTAGLVQASAREAADADKLRELALAPRNLAYFVHPYIFGSYAEGNYFGRDHHYEVCGLVGTLALLLGLVGAAYGRGRARVFAIALVPLALFMALAHQNPLYEILPRVPGFNWFRGAGRYVLLSSLGLAILAAWGIQALGEQRRALKLALALGLAGTLLCVAVPVGFRMSREAVVPRLQALVSDQDVGREAARAAAEEKFAFLASRLSPSDPTYLMLALCLVLTTAACGASLAGRMAAHHIGTLAVVLTAAQLFVFARDYNPTIDRAYYETPPQLAGLLDTAAGECLYMHDQEAVQQALPGRRGWAHGDRSFYFTERETLRPNRQVLYGVRSASVFYALVQERYWTVIRLLTHSLDGRADPETGLRMAAPTETLGAMGVRLVCTADRAAASEWPPAADFGAWIARENPAPAPVAYFAEGIVPCWTEEAALRHLTGPTFRWARPVVEIGPDDMLVTTSGAEPSRITSVGRERGDLVIGVEAAGRAFLVVREMWDARFRCLVDGAPTPIYRVNYLFRGVEVGPGERTVRFVYDARDLRLGMVVSALALAALLLCLARRPSQLTELA